MTEGAHRVVGALARNSPPPQPPSRTTGRLLPSYGLTTPASRVIFPSGRRRGQRDRRKIDPLSGGGRVSNYRVRQVMRLRRRQRVKDFLIGLATFMADDSRTTQVGIDALMEAAGQARNTFREARREAEKAGDVISMPTGTGRGHRTQWTVLCLPEVSPEITRLGKGVSDVNPVSAADPLSGLKGVNRSPERGSNDPGKGGQPRGADQQEPRMLNRRAKPSGSQAVRDVIRAAVPDATDDETDTFARQVQEEHNPDTLASYIRAFPAARVTAAIADIRRGGKGGNFRTAPAAATPTPPPFANMCDRCGHDRSACPEPDTCPDRATLARDTGGDGREEFARSAAAIKARSTARAPAPPGAVDPDECRDVLSKDYGDGDHAA
jgi:hypothetical protein